MSRTGAHAGQVIGTLNGQQVAGLDIAKRVFQLHTVDMATGEIVNLQIKRAKVKEYFGNRRPFLVGIEACGSAHYWAPSWRRHCLRSLTILRTPMSGPSTRWAGLWCKFWLRVGYRPL